ncbi:MAG TPA: GNAT family N-acetyltransferase [Anaerolineales bacterium]|nr:GNAT family N-acetyltransferase [Anaerolineales bacterium]
MILRPAIASDELAIQRLIREGRINPMGVRWERFVVIEAPDGELAAIGQVKPHRDGSLELASIVTAPEYRGRGLARRVIEHLVASNPGVLYLMCRADFGPMYEKFGFRDVSEADMPKYFRRVSKLAGFADKLVDVPLRIMRRDERANGRITNGRMGG